MLVFQGWITLIILGHFPGMSMNILSPTMLSGTPAGGKSQGGTMTPWGQTLVMAMLLTAHPIQVCVSWETLVEDLKDWALHLKISLTLLSLCMGSTRSSDVPLFFMMPMGRDWCVPTLDTRQTSQTGAASS